MELFFGLLLGHELFRLLQPTITSQALIVVSGQRGMINGPTMMSRSALGFVRGLLALCPVHCEMYNVQSLCRESNMPSFPSVDDHRGLDEGS